ncbi:MAG: LEA type 2 family protein [Gemmatimonadaceae bacterium]|nr:LEA type 2 family protein [Gemmatimonadaceae bacterium]MCW5825438.1 LEA type 2 family protein [Gemmatimonadaceae bacterium]
MRLILLTLATLSLTSCQSFLRRAFAAPEVEVRDVRVRSIGLAGGTIDVVLDVANPNEYRIDAEKVTYNFYVDTTRVVTGEITQRLTMEEKGRISLTVPVTFDFAALGVALRYYNLHGALDYKVDGNFTLVTPIGRFTRPYQGRGRVEGMP